MSPRGVDSLASSLAAREGRLLAGASDPVSVKTVFGNQGSGILIVEGHNAVHLRTSGVAVPM